MPVTGATRVFGLIGHPVRHSLSPAMHNALFERHGIDATYVAFDVHPDQAAHLATAIRTLDLQGANLTVPFKSAILPHLDHVTQAAQEAGAVNVVIQHDGFLTGYNTDGEGFVRGLERDLGVDPAGLRVVVLGAGGAARAVGASLAQRGAVSVSFLNRGVERAEKAARMLTPLHPHTAFGAGPLNLAAFAQHASATQLVVNCTSGGARELVEQLEPSLLPPGAAWCDINYWMSDPPCLDAATRCGLRTQMGLPMLVHQGALSFELFTGVPVDPVLIRQYLG